MWSANLPGSFGGLPFNNPRRGRNQRKRVKKNSSGRHSTSSGSGGTNRINTGGSAGKSAKPVSGNGSAGSSGNWITDKWGAATAGFGKAVGDWQSKPKKFEVPVRVDVDWVKPTMESMRQMAQESWEALPPPVQRVAPYVGVSLLTGIIVQKWNNRTINNERHKNDELQTTIVSMHKENKELEGKIKKMQEDSFNSPRLANEMKMAEAVAQATSAAAAAAEAAATAATACGLRVRKALPQSSQS